MAVEVVVGPPLITINLGDTFLVSEPDGFITAYTEQGSIRATRDMSATTKSTPTGNTGLYRIPERSRIYAWRSYLMNPKIITECNEIPEKTVSLILDRAVIDSGIHEDFDIRNYDKQRIRFSLEISLRTDFADIFEVKAKRIVRKGNVTTEWHKESAELISSYEHDQFKRSMTTRLLRADSTPNRWISFLVDLSPGASWHTCCLHSFSWAKQPSAHCVEEIRNRDSNVEQALKKLERRLRPPSRPRTKMSIACSNNRTRTATLAGRFLRRKCACSSPC